MLYIPYPTLACLFWICLRFCTYYIYKMIHLSWGTPTTLIRERLLEKLALTSHERKSLRSRRHSGTSAIKCLENCAIYPSPLFSTVLPAYQLRAASSLDLESTWRSSREKSQANGWAKCSGNGSCQCCWQPCGWYMRKQRPLQMGATGNPSRHCFLLDCTSAICSRWWS